MVDPQKRQIRSCLEAASLSSFRGSFEAEEGDDTNLPPRPGSASASPTTSFGKATSSGEISDTEVRRQPRLSHESSMNVGDLPPPALGGTLERMSSTAAGARHGSPPSRACSL